MQNLGYVKIKNFSDWHKKAPPNNCLAGRIFIAQKCSLSLEDGLSSITRLRAKAFFDTDQLIVLCSTI